MKDQNTLGNRIRHYWNNLFSEKRTELQIPHNSGEATFLFPAFGGDTYRRIGKSILSRNLQVPTGDYTASLLHYAYCNPVANEQESNSVKNIVENSWLWMFNINLWTEKGVYVIQDKEAMGVSQNLDIGNLEKALENGKEINGVRFSEDGRVRFASKWTYRYNPRKDLSYCDKHYLVPEDLSKDGFVVASFGKEGAEKIGEISAKFGGHSSLRRLNIEEGKRPEGVLNISTIEVETFPAGRRREMECKNSIWIHGFGWEPYNWFYAFGISNQDKANR